MSNLVADYSVFVAMSIPLATRGKPGINCFREGSTSGRIHRAKSLIPMIYFDAMLAITRVVRLIEKRRSH
jgi:hypothetical protein